MYSELKPLDDHGANTLSPQLETTEQALRAYVTFIQCNADAAFVGLGDGSVRVYALSDNGVVNENGVNESAVSEELNGGPWQNLDPSCAKVFSAGGLPLCAAVCPVTQRLLLGTDQSCLLEISGSELRNKAQLAKGWVEHVAVSASGLSAYASNKTCYVLDGTRQLCQIPQSAGSISGLQFSADSKDLAIAGYGGIGIWRVAENKLLHELQYPGAHLNMRWSPDGRYLVTATPDKEIHCWDLSKKTSFRMRGYPAKIRSLCWSADGKHLAAAGADSVTVWPFVNGNPSGKPPYEFGYSFEGIVTEVAAHPSEPIIAAGYNNGTVLMGRYLKGEAIIARAASNDAVSALAWSGDGRQLFVGTQKGQLCRVALKNPNF